MSFQHRSLHCRSSCRFTLNCTSSVFPVQSFQIWIIIQYGRRDERAVPYLHTRRCRFYTVIFHPYYTPPHNTLSLSRSYCIFYFFSPANVLYYRGDMPVLPAVFCAAGSCLYTLSHHLRFVTCGGCWLFARHYYFCQL